MSSQFGNRESWNVVVYCNWVEKMQVEIDVKADNEDDAYRLGVTAHKTYCGCNPRPAGLMVQPNQVGVGGKYPLPLQDRGNQRYEPFRGIKKGE